MAITISSAPLTASWSKNPIEFTLCTDSSNENRAIIVRLCVETLWGSDEWEEIEFRPKLNDNGCTTFDLQHMLDSCLQFDCPEFGTLVPMVHQLGHKRYRIKYAEQYSPAPGELTELQEFTEGFIRNVTKGGIDSKAGSIQEFFVNYVQGICKSLTWKPSGMKATCYSPEFISIMLAKKTSPTLGLVYELTLNDGTVVGPYVSTGATINENSDSINFGGMPIISFPAGLYSLGFEQFGIEPCDIREWTAWIIDDSGQELSEHRTYIYQEHCDRTHYYLWCNSLGGIDALCVNGLRKERVGIRGSSGADGFGNSFQFKKKKRISYSQTTGRQFDKNQACWFPEFLLADSVKELIFCVDTKLWAVPDIEHGYYCQVEIDFGNYSLLDTLVFCYNFQFNVKQSNEEVVCTPVLCPCIDEAGITCDVTEQLVTACPVVTAFQFARCYSRRNGNWWRVYVNIQGLFNQLANAGAFNIQIAQEIENTATGNTTNLQPLIWQNPNTGTRIYTRMRVSGNTEVEKVIYRGQIEFDFVYQGRTHRICYLMEEHCVERPPANQGWQLEWLEFTCEDKTPRTVYCLNVQAADVLGTNSQIATESTMLSIDNGASSLPAILPYQQCFDQEDIIRIIIEREITTTKCPFPLKTFAVKEICNCNDVLPMLRIVECSVNPNDAGSHCIIVEADLSIYSCPPTNIEIFFRGDNAPNWAPGNWYCFAAVNTIGPNSIDTYEIIAANAVPWSFTTATQLTLNWNTPVSAFDGNAVQIKFGGCDFTTTVFTDSNGQSVTISFPINGLLYFNWNIYGLSLALSENYEPTGPNAEKLMAMQNEAIEQIAILSAAISADPSYTLVSVESAGFCGLCENPLVNLRLQLTFDTCGIITRDFTAEQTDLHGNPCEILLTATT